MNERPSPALVTVMAYWFADLSSKVEERVVVSRLAGPVAPGVHEKVQAKVLPLEMVRC